MKPKKQAQTRSSYKERMTFQSFGPQISPAYAQIIKQHKASQERIARMKPRGYIT